ncbi:nucleotidyltransferase domain-containing protein [Candidatus Dependentiae bacterium]|nr:nucleotidyltransferase domain-containing protein [Candidatus Dependentiae bacterium]
MISFKSKITKILLSYFFLNEDIKMYVNNMAEKFNLDKRNLVKKLKELEKEGILKTERLGNLKFYTLNKDFSLYSEFRSIILKTTGIQQIIKDKLIRFKNIEHVFIFGSYARDNFDALSDIDILIVGEADTIQINRLFSKLQKEYDREFNVINMSIDEFKKKKKQRNSFINNILNKKHIKLI